VHYATLVHRAIVDLERRRTSFCAERMPYVFASQLEGSAVEDDAMDVDEQESTGRANEGEMIFDLQRGTPDLRQEMFEEQDALLASRLRLFLIEAGFGGRVVLPSRSSKIACTPPPTPIEAPQLDTLVASLTLRQRDRASVRSRRSSAASAGPWIERVASPLRR
jgi:hypothetical protein